MESQQPEYVDTHLPSGDRGIRNSTFGRATTCRPEEQWRQIIRQTSVFGTIARLPEF